MADYQIQGQLPFQPANAGGMFGGDLAGSYQSAYNSALGQNQANYQNILSGYQQTLRNQTSSQDAIGKGYGDLYNTVMGGIQGIDASQRQAIQDQYARQSGGLAQQLTSSGLGNTTVAGSMQRGVDLDRAKADVALSNQTAQLQAGYQSNLGLANLNYQNQANMQNTALAGQQLNWMNSVNALYPTADAYSKLAQQQGQFGQMNADRGQNADQFQQQLRAAQAPRGGGFGGGGAITRPPAPDLGPMSMGHASPGYGVQDFSGGGVGAAAFYGSGGFAPAQGAVMRPQGSGGSGGLGGLAGGAMNAIAAYQATQGGMGQPEIPTQAGEDTGGYGGEY